MTNIIIKILLHLSISFQSLTIVEEPHLTAIPGFLLSPALVFCRVGISSH